MPHGDDNSWIQTFSGKKFYPLDPRAEDVDIIDIAHSLSLLCRFTGHCREFYCVAQHSVHVAEVVAQLKPGLVELELAALCHDAAEAYFADIASPVKKEITEIKAIEHRLEAAIATRYEYAFPYDEVVKKADLILLSTERRDLMATPPRPWSTYNEPLDRALCAWSSGQAEKMFLNKFYDIIKRR